MRAERIRIEVRIDMGWLMHDIKNETYLRGRSVGNDTNYKEAAEMMATGEDENGEKILRSIKRGMAEVKDELSEYIRDVKLSGDNTSIEPDDDMLLKLWMPANYNAACVDALAEAVHDYLRNTAVADWYLVTNKADAADYAALAAKAMVNIRKAAARRSRPERPSIVMPPLKRDTDTTINTD